MNFIILCTSNGEQPALFLGAASQLKSIWGRSCLDLICTEGSLHWVVTATTGFWFYWSFQLVGSMPAGASVWSPFWNQLLESMALLQVPAACESPRGGQARGLWDVRQQAGAVPALPAAVRGPTRARSCPCPKGAALPSPHRGEGACWATGMWGAERSFWDRGDPRAAEVPVDALQSWLHPDMRHRVPFCSQTFNSQCQVVLCYVMLLCYTVLC